MLSLDCTGHALGQALFSIFSTLGMQTSHQVVTAERVLEGSHIRLEQIVLYACTAD